MSSAGLAFASQIGMLWAEGFLGINPYKGSESIYGIISVVGVVSYRAAESHTRIPANPETNIYHFVIFAESAPWLSPAEGTALSVPDDALARHGDLWK